MYFLLSLFLGVCLFLYFFTPLKTVPIQTYFINPSGQFIAILLIGFFTVPAIWQSYLQKIANEKQFKKVGSNLKLTLTNKELTAFWLKDEVSGSVPWSYMTRLRKTETFWILFYNGFSSQIYIPTSCLTSEIKIFIEDKLIEYNVPIK